MGRSRKIIIATAAAVAVAVSLVGTIGGMKAAADQSRHAEYVACLASNGADADEPDLEVAELCSHGPQATAVDWTQYATPIRGEIAAMERRGDCPGLFARYGIAQDEAAGDDLLEYLRESLTATGCW